MSSKILQTLKQALIFIIIFTFLTGILYPVVVTILAKVLFKNQADGSLIEQDGVIIGSKLLGQQFTEKKYFWGRPSAAKDFPYNPIGSSGSNLGPSNPNLLKIVQQRIALLKTANSLNKNHVPIDLVTSSASGLDPHISLEAAHYQIERIAIERKITVQSIIDLLHKHTISNQIPILNVPCVNVLELNLALNQISKSREIK